MNINWKWPQKRKNNLLPWYTILWRCIWFVALVCPAAGIIYLGVLLAFGVDEANSFIKDVFWK